MSDPTYLLDLAGVRTILADETELPVSSVLDVGPGLSATYDSSARKVRLDSQLDVFAASSYGASPTASATGNTTAIQAAIDAAYNQGGGTVVVSRALSINSTIVLKRAVNIQFLGGAKFVWTGSTSGTCVETDSTDVVLDCSWYGLHIDTGASFAGIGFYIHSCEGVYADVITITCTGTTSKAIVCKADSTGGSGPTGRRHTAYCHFASIHQEGTCGTLLEIGGIPVGILGGPQQVTLNSFGQIYGAEQDVCGIKVIDWADSNHVYGKCRLAIQSNNSIGIWLGSAGDTTVYNWHFSHASVDSFNTFTGRIGLKLSAGVSGIKFDQYLQDPAAEGGSLDIHASAVSYDISYLFVNGVVNNAYHRYARRAWLATGTAHNFESNIAIQRNQVNRIISDSVANYLDAETGGADIFRVNGAEIGRFDSTQLWVGIGILRLGTATPATAGVIRMPAALTMLSGRNNANTQNLLLLRMDGSDGYIIGDETNGTAVSIRGTTTLSLRIGANNMLQCTTTTVDITTNAHLNIVKGQALGGGAAATLGTIAGSGPATAAQNKWIEVKSSGTTGWIPFWI